MKRKSIHIHGLLVLVLLLACLGSVMSSRAQGGDAYALIDAVNTLRINNGLPPYEINNILMSIAQDQTDYQAAIGVCTHTGAGGTTYNQRAANAGYGGGATFWMTENYGCGTNMSLGEVITMWLGDAEHTMGMLGASYVDAGAGVTVSGDFVYYTLDVAYVAGSGNYVPTAIITPGGPTPLPYYAVQTVTPMPDGSLIHVVKPGQNLSSIAKAYGVLVIEIKELNNLNSDNIYDGDKLLIRKASTPGPNSTGTATPTPTRVASPTRYPTRTPTLTATATVATPVSLAVDLGQGNAPQAGSDPLGSILVIAIIALAGGGIVLMVVGSVLRRSAAK